LLGGLVSLGQGCEHDFAVRCGIFRHEKQNNIWKLLLR
jgi:hypothetical protein